MDRPNRPADRETVPMTFRLTKEARALLIELARRQGVSMTALLEVLLRKAAKDEGIKPGHNE